MVNMNFFNNNGPFSLQKIAEVCQARLTKESDAVVMITDIAPLNEAKENEICFFYDKKNKEQAGDIKATACITTEDLAPFVNEKVIKLITANPKLAFLKLNMAMYTEIKIESGIAASAHIHPSAIIGENTSIGENVVIGKNVKIGRFCRIEHNVVIDEGCEVGNNTRIGVGAHIAYSLIGNDCYIYSGVRLGQDGFGFMMLEGKHQRIPQVGILRIGNDVEIGANACVDRGALGDTIIGDGCRIDNLVQIAHNDKMGRGCVVVAQTGIAGSCTFGDYVVCGGQTGFADHLHIGSGAQIGAQSGLVRDVEPGAVVMGTPAVNIKDFMRQVSFLQKSANPKK